jgi:hypothetical protein
MRKTCRVKGTKKTRIQKRNQWGIILTWAFMNNIYFTILTLVLFLFYMRDSVTDKHHLKLYVLFSCKPGIELPNPSFYCFSSRVLMWSQKNKDL